MQSCILSNHHKHIFIQDECSYVSLRDIVRAMIVFEWFLKKLSKSQELNVLLQQKEMKEIRADIEVSVV